MERFVNRIVLKCEELLSGSAESQRAAYRWLRHCRPFRIAVSELQRQGFTFFQVARMLSRHAPRRETDVALARLERALIDTDTEPAESAIS